MDYACEVVVNAVASDIVGRIISCAMDNLLRPSSASTRDAHRQHLEQLLYSIGSAVAEAEGRCITNLELLAQLKALNDAKCRGRFALEFTEIDDILKNKAKIGDDDAEEDSVVTTTRKRKFALCLTFNAEKRGRLRTLIGLGGDGDGSMTEKRLVAAVKEMEALTGECMRDFIQLVQGYPRRTEVPWSLTTTLFMDRYVFGRHVEKERIVTFLLQRAPRATGLNALAVVGAKGVGKTTLVKHACDDERVRGHFARVEWFECSWVLDAGGFSDLTNSKCGWPDYLAGVRCILDEPRFWEMDRSLLVFDNALPVDDEEAAWAALLATSKLAAGSKLLFTCGDADLARIVSTVEPVVLWPLQEEEYWYYFKAFAFGDTDLRDHPRISAVGRDISHHLGRTFLEARVLGPLLRANFDARFWRSVLAAVIMCQTRPRDGIIGLLLELLPFRARVQWEEFGRIWTPPKLILQDVLGASAASSSGSGASCLGSDDMEEDFTIHPSRETLYMDGWYSITFKNDSVQPSARRFLRAASRW